MDMAERNLPVIAETLAQYGFRSVPGTEITFTGEIPGQGGPWRIQLEQIDPAFVRLPVARLIDPDSGTGGLRPHIDDAHAICYLDRESVRLDPLNPQRCIEYILGALRSTLEQHGSTVAIEQEIEREFAAYWKPDRRRILMLHHQSGVSRVWTMAVSGQEELLLAKSQEQAEYWATGRCASGLAPTPYRAVIITLEKGLGVPAGTPWPPEDLRALVAWLEDWTPKAARELMQQMAKALKASASLIVVLRPNNGAESVALSITYESDIADHAARHQGRRRNPEKLKKLLTSRVMVQDFKRHFVWDALEKRLVKGRLADGITLRDKRVALIGCGSVGSEAARLLVRAGAGAGRGELDLFDSDILKPENLSRHALPPKYLFLNKAEALGDYLQETATHVLRINAQEQIDAEQIDTLARHDLIIELTGDETFSIALAMQYHQLRVPAARKKPVLIHGWIEGHGDASRVLIDEGKGKYACYYCLDKRLADGTVQPRVPVLKRGVEQKDVEPVFQCGGTYFSYAGGAAAITAGMVQKAALEVVQGDIPGRLKQTALSGRADRSVIKNLRRDDACPCCGYRQGIAGS